MDGAGEGRIVGRKHVCVLYGGRSLERDVSINTGTRVARALEARGHQVSPVDVDESLVRRLVDLNPDVGFIAMHGKGGEDGTVQELLEILGIPYAGAGVSASIRAMDKVLTKHTLLRRGLPTPRFHAFSDADFRELGAKDALDILSLIHRSASIRSMDKVLTKHTLLRRGLPTPRFHAFSDAAFRELGAKDALDIIADQLGLPLVVKPAAQGSALGISVVGEARDLPRAMVSALSFDRKVMLEEFISGRELAVSIMGTQDPRVLPIVEAVPKSGHDFYDFESRYTPGETEFNVPASLESAVAEEVERISLETYRALGCSGFGRVDIILDAADRPWILELNTIPGLTETSLMPAAAEAAGLSFEDLVETVVATAFEPKAE